MKRSLTLRALGLALVALMAVGAGMAEAQTQKKGGVLRSATSASRPRSTRTGAPRPSPRCWRTTSSRASTPRRGLPAHPDAGRGMPHRLQGRAHLHHQAPTGRQVPQRQGDDRRTTWSPRSCAGASAPSYGKSLFAQVVDFKAVDKYTVEIKLKEKSGDRRSISLAVPNNFGAIYPKEIADKFPPDQRITEWVGTGPFKLAEWKPDQYIRMVRFDDYKPLAGKQSGYGGAKIVHVDELRWIPVPDAASRAAQVESGRPRLRRRPRRRCLRPPQGQRRTSSPSSSSPTTGSSRSSTRRKA